MEVHYLVNLQNKFWFTVFNAFVRASRSDNKTERSNTAILPSFAASDKATLISGQHG